MKTLKILLVALLALNFAAACDDDDNTSDVEICNDGLDNDGDNQIDCYDPDCATFAGCTNNNVTTETSCTDNIDNDNDGDIDCDDSDCANNTACTTPTENCANGTDDDGDGDIDCNDSDCVNDIACATDQCTADTVFYDTAANVCDDGFYCSINNEYAATCVQDAASAGGTNYGDCGANGECPVGAICAGDGTTSSCMPFCHPTTHPLCPDGGSCMYTLGETGFYLCAMVETCDVIPNSCSTAGDACYIYQDGSGNVTTGCFEEGTTALGATCGSVNECPAESACLGDGQGGYACTELCRLAEGDADCSAGTCSDMGDATYGACVAAK